VPRSHSSLTPGADIELSNREAGGRGPHACPASRQVVLVGRAIPGEQVRVRVERVSKQVAFAVMAARLAASTDRRPDADDGTCGGSVYAHIATRVSFG
jgi:tRNA/tmRNA/rRNA uracil-C5-methylase (TrmA/RlmC/RlmD family)